MTAVPPRPAAPDCTCGHDGLPANFHMTPCPIKVAHFARLAAPDATAGDGLREALRIHHPIMRSETGPFSGCRCGQVTLGQDVIGHVVDELRRALDGTA